MNEPMDDDKLAKQAKAAFDDSVERLDAATLSQLNQRRQAALAELGKSKSSAQWLRWAPATGVAAAAIVTVMVMNGPDVAEPDFDAAVTDFEILTGEDSLEMLEELEFYSWMEMADLETNGNVG